MDIKLFAHHTVLFFERQHPVEVVVHFFPVRCFPPLVKTELCILYQQGLVVFPLFLFFLILAVGSVLGKENGGGKPVLGMHRPGYEIIGAVLVMVAKQPELLWVCLLSVAPIPFILFLMPKIQRRITSRALDALLAEAAQAGNRNKAMPKE